MPRGIPPEPALIDPEQYDASEQQFAASLDSQTDDGQTYDRQAGGRRVDDEQTDDPRVGDQRADDWQVDDRKNDDRQNDDQSNFASGFLPDVESEPQFESGRPVPSPPSVEAGGGIAPGMASAAAKTLPPVSSEDSRAWRNEVSARVSSYRSRRPRAPRYPSLQLKFESSEPRWNYRSTETSPPAVRPASEINHDLAEGQTAAEPAQMRREPAPQGAAQSGQNYPLDSGSRQSGEGQSFTTQSAATQQSAAFQPNADLSTAPVPDLSEGASNLLEFPRPEFPRPMTPPVRPADELAEPVQDRLRIIEAPEITPPPPALGGILIESKEEPAADRRPGFEIPLQSSSLSRRITAAAVDAIIVLAAGALFGYIAVKTVAPVMQARELAGTACLVLALLWAGYQYLALVYTGSTPGLRMAGLELVRFSGKPAPRRLRRWRFFASLLSAVSLALGYFWCFLDEDGLCWHDRITRTHMSPKK